MVSAVPPTRYDAVIFDLFGTLVDDAIYHAPNAQRRGAIGVAMADILGVPRDAFLRLWDETVSQRDAGVFQTTEACLVYVLHELGVSGGTSQIQEAARLRLEYVRLTLEPRPDALETLASLKTSGYKVGLLSNCSDGVAILWPTTPFAEWMDVTVLSCEVGLTKPDPRIYHLACERLGVRAEKCLFVGDGGSNELSAASELGMGAVLIRTPDDTEDGSRQSWNGTRISALGEVLSLLV